MAFATAFATKNLPWPGRGEEARTKYQVICAPGVIGGIVGLDMFLVHSTYPSERKMIDRVFSPTEEAAKFLDLHPEIEPVLHQVALEYGRFFEEKPALGLALFNDPERVKDFLMVNICPRWDYDPMRAIQEMGVFEDWARPFSLPYRDRLFFNLFYEQRKNVFRMAR